jgi:hypothetical protein
MAYLLEVHQVLRQSIILWFGLESAIKYPELVVEVSEVIIKYPTELLQ